MNCMAVTSGQPTKDSVSQSKTQWVDSVFNSLSQEEKIAQLLFLRANHHKQGYLEQVSKYIEKYNVGGVTFFGSTPWKQAKQTNYWQGIAKTPLLITIDAEWGLAMRLDSIIPLPYQMTLGAIQNNDLIYKTGQIIGKQCREMGIHINFAPVADINNNPENPVINFRSFGENPENVIKKSIAISRGIRSQGVLATAKHFPGHGDTDTDSHQTLPIIPYTMRRLDSVELLPFKALIKDRIDAIMIAHLYIPELEKTKNLASTLSKSIVHELLRKKLDYNGLIITDALDMKGVTRYFKPGDIEVKALMAGNDILLLPENVPKAIKAIQKALEDGTLKKEIIEQKCKKILDIKYQCGIHHHDSIATGNLLKRLNSDDIKFLNDELYKNAITLIKNDHDLIPLKNTDDIDIASLVIGKEKPCAFTSSLDLYNVTDHYYIPGNPDKSSINSLLHSLEKHDMIIIALYGKSLWPQSNYGISESSIDLIQEIAGNKKIALDVFANPYALSLFDSTTNIEAILISYQEDHHSEFSSAELICGGIGARGKLPVTINKEFPERTGSTTSKTRLEYTYPEAFNLTKEEITLFDSIALSGIKNKAYPGCQVLAAKDGKVFYYKTFGYHTYDSINPVDSNDLYDLASLTKVAATTLAIMKLYEENKIDIDGQLQEYLPYLKDSQKGKLVIRDILAHQGGLQAWIPYYKFTLNDNGDPDSLTYNTTISEEFPVRVAENFYIRNNYQFYIFDSIIYSPSRENFEYKYSDLGFYLLAAIVEYLSNKSFETYLQQNFYKTLGLNHTLFKPRRKFHLEKIIPTENDKIFRKQLVHGDVHDPGAAMLGGVSGHAGLFSNANDLAKIMYMLLNKGQYGGRQFLDSTTIKEFTSCQFPLNLNRRGLGFDKPLLVYEENNPNCKSTSHESYGHSGFTGTYIWADPEENLIYIFLSNRVYPNGTNTKLMELNIRTNLHQAIYDALSKNKTSR